MIPTKYCRFTGCRNSQLETIEEVDIGFCSRHKNEINSENHVTLSCWTCGELIDTVHKERLVKGTRIEDDYIFTKYCPKCDWNADLKSMQFVTVSNEVDKDLSQVVTDDGRIVAPKLRVIKH